jgi:cytochrome b
LFVAAYLIERPRELHEGLGYALAAIIAVRIVWGFVGTKHARFVDFVPSPAGFFVYIRAMIKGRERRYVGHNPAGGAMVIALMLCLCSIICTGWMMGLDAFWGKEWVEDLHEGLVSFAILLVTLHVAGVIYESLRHGENLVRAMISGKKRVD